MTRFVEFSALGGPEVLQFVEGDAAPPGPGDVQIEMKAAGLNRAELLFMAGRYLVDTVLPSRLGFEGAGRIIALGAGVTRFAVGERVAITPAFPQNAYGVLGERVNMPEGALEPIVGDIDDRTAAAFWMAHGTAYGLLVQTGGLRAGAGQCVVINAASSSVGTAAFQIVRAHGGVAIALTRTAAKVEQLRYLGADHVIITEAEAVTARIFEITDGRGFDIALDAVAGPGSEALAAAAGFEATMVIYGRLSGTPAPLPFYPMVAKGLRVTGFHLAWALLDHPGRRESAVAHLNSGLASGAYRPVIDRVFPFAEVGEAYRYMAGNNQLGKIVVEIGT